MEVEFLELSGMEDQGAIDYYRSLSARGIGTDEIIAAMKADGLTIVRSIITLSQVIRISVPNSKQLVTSHSEWQEAVVNAQPLHDALESAFRELEREDINLPLNLDAPNSST